MVIEIFADNLIKEDIKNNAILKTSRAIILNNEKILLEYTKSRDFYMLPGGGVEKSETFAECVKREVLEETGYIVKPLRESVTVVEHYPEKSVEGHFFICELLSENACETKRTSEEEHLDLELKWFDVVDALTTLDGHDTADELGIRFMERDFIAIINSV